MQLDSDIRYLTGKKRKNCFGKVGLFSDIEFNGQIIKPREGNNGFFYNIPPFGNFLPGSDLHISIFDISGFAKAHITFKPYINNLLAFHYGYKFKNSKIEEFWITGINQFDENVTQDIYQDIYELYYELLKLVYITRTDDQGNILKSPYKFNIQGTAGRIRNTEQKDFAIQEYSEQHRDIPSHLKPSGGVSKNRRLTQSFKKGPLFN